MKPIVILLVEDDPDDIELAKFALRQEGVTEEIVVARDGAEALKYFEGVSPLSSDMEDETETIVLLDISIPKIDGFEVCRCLRARKTDRPPYIIMVTAQDAKETIVEGLEAGADDYIAKPFDPGELRARIGVGRRILAMQDGMAEKVQTLQEALDEIAAFPYAVPSGESTDECD